MSELSKRANSDWVSSMQDRSLTRFMEQLLAQTSITYGSSKSSDDETFFDSVVNGDPITVDEICSDSVTTNCMEADESASNHVKSPRKKKSVKEGKNVELAVKLPEVNRRKRSQASSPPKQNQKIGCKRLKLPERTDRNKIKLTGGRSAKVEPVRRASDSIEKSVGRNHSKTKAAPKLLKRKSEPILKTEPKTPRPKAEAKQLNGKRKSLRPREKAELKPTKEITVKKQLPCEDCNKVFLDVHRLNGHRRVVHYATNIEGDEKRQFECKQCKQKFTLRHHLLQHVLAHEGFKPFICVLCDKHYSCVSNLNLHIRMKHDDNSPTFTCTTCSVSFKRRCLLAMHTLSEHGSASLFTCKVCAHKFTTMGSLSRHMLIHTGEMSHTCPACQRSFRYKESLKYHYMREHTDGEKPYQCPSCDKSFATPVNLSIHSVVHSGIMRFRCQADGCGKAYRSRQAFNTHMRSHTGEQSFKCDECDRHFRDLTYLRRHQQRRHAPLDASALKHVCTVCGHVFFVAADLQRHMRVHNNERPYACKLCPKTFIQNAHLQGHEATHLNLKSWKCARCGRGFNRKHNLKLHMRTMKHEASDSAASSQNGENIDQNTGTEMIQVKFDADAEPQMEQDDMIE